MVSRKREQAALATREAHRALLEVKRLVDSAAQKTHAARIGNCRSSSCKFTPGGRSEHFTNRSRNDWLG
jgi:hypothetical protein